MNRDKVQLLVTDEQMKLARELMGKPDVPDREAWEKIVGVAMADQIQAAADDNREIVMVTQRILDHQRGLSEQRAVREVTKKLEGGNLHPHLGSGMSLLPAAPGVCAACAVEHPADQPHNKDSLHYQYDFYGQTGRRPTWEDAMAHCSDEVKAEWRKELAAAGQKLD